MTAAERAAQREAFDAAQEEYARACARYEDERAKWVEVWRAAGREPPPTTPPEIPDVLRHPKWGDCPECFGCGAAGGGNEWDERCRSRVLNWAAQRWP